MTEENATPEPLEEAQTAEEVVNTDSTPVNPNVSTDSEPVENDVVDLENTDDEGSEPQEKQGQESKVVRELKEQRRKRQDLEKEVAYLKGLQASQQVPQAKPISIDENAEPSMDDFDDFSKYEKAKDEYLERKVEKRIMAKLESKQQEQEFAKQGQTFDQKLAELGKKDPEKVQKILYAPINDLEIARVIKGMEYGIEVATYLADHPDEAINIDRNPGPQAFLKLGKIEERLKTPKLQPQKNKVSQAPEPLKPVSSSSGGLKKQPKDMSIEEYTAYRDKQRYGS